MGDDAIILILMMVIGFFMGVATLPYMDKINFNISPILHVTTFTLLWPYLLLCGLGIGIKTYYHAWCYFLDNKELFYPKTKESAFGMREFMKNHDSIRKTYFDE